MLDLKFIREQPEMVRAAVRDKHVALDVDELLARDQALLKLSRTVQELQELRNQQAKLVPKASVEERPRLIQEGREIGERIAALKPEVEQAEAALRELLLLVPNIPANEAPRGESEADNVQVRTWGNPRKFSFKPLDHVELLQKNGWYELDRIAKVAGSRSYALKGQAVLLEQNLLRLALDTMIDRGFTPLSVPSFATEAALVGTGHFPTGREQVTTSSWTIST